MKRALALVLATLGWLAPVGAAPEEPPAKLLKSVSAGFDGGAPRDHPAPVWVTLVNGGEQQESFTLSAVSGDARGEVQVDLPAGGRRRVCLAIRIRQADVLVQVERGGAVLERRQIKNVKRLDTRRHLLSIDGRPPERRAAAGSRRRDPSLYVTAIDQGDAPTEAACYEAFGAVLLRGIDPEAWDRDQLGAVLEYAAQGGTLILGGVTPGRNEQKALLARLGAQPTAAKLLGRPARMFDYGQGRVLTFRDDVLLAALQAGGKAAQAKQDLGDLVQSGAGQVRFAPTFETYRGTFPDHPASGSQALVGGFLIVYLLAIGPVLAFAFRKSSRKRLALATLIGLASFSLLAFVVAGAVRVGAGVAFVNEVVYVPKRGPALHVSDITVVSGGASRYKLEVTAPEELAATILPAATDQYVDRWRARDENRFRGTRTQRGTDVALDLAMPLWGQQSVATLAVVPDVKPLSATLRRVGRGYQVRVKNTTGRPLERALVMELNNSLSKYTGYVELGTLAPGAEKIVPVVRNARLRAPRDKLDELAWHAKLGVPEHWRAWTRIVRPARGGGARLSFAVVSVIPNRLQARGRNLRPEENALRIDPVEVDASLERGYLGLVLEEGNRGVRNGRTWVEARVLRVQPNGPAARAGIAAGMIIQTVHNRQVVSPQYLRDQIGRHLPGERVMLGVSDPTTGRYRNIRVRLGSRAEVPTGD